MESWIQTYTGRKVDPMAIRTEDIDIRDIAHALSMQCRFAGHCSDFYSVAQHSWHVSARCEDEDALHGLLHDASEAYLVDIPRPLKRHFTFEEYRTLEAVVTVTIYGAFGMVPYMPESVQTADERMLATEYECFMQPEVAATRGTLPDWGLTHTSYGFPIEAMRWQDAEKKFLKRFEELTKGR